MDDTKKTKARLIAELKEMRTKNIEIENKENISKKRGCEWSLDQLWDLYSHSPIPSMILSMGGNIIKYNNAMKKLTGYSHKEVPDLSVWMPKLYPDKSYRKQVIKISGKSRKRKIQVIQKEFIITRKNGDKRIVEFYVYDIFRDGKAIDCQIIQCVDITERKKTEETLRLTQFAIEHSPEAAYWMGKNARFIYVNEASCNALGYSKEELLGMTVHDIGPEFSKEVWLGHFEDLRKRQSFTIDTIHQKKNGDIFPVEITENYVNFAGKEYNCAFARDVTESKKAEEALLESKKDLIKTQRIAHIGNWRLNVATNQVVWSEELYKMYGFDPTLPPPPHTERMNLFTRESWKTLSTSLAKTRETGIPYELELETVRKDGSNGWMWVRGEAETDSAGNTIGLWGAAQDITERKKTEKSLLESEDFLNRTGDIAKVGGWQINFETGKVLWTRTTGRIHELPDGFYPDLEDAINYYHPDDRKLVRESINRAIEDGETFNFETRLITAKGHERWVRAIGQPIHKEGKCVRLSGTFQDITEWKKAEEEIFILSKFPSENPNPVMRLSKNGVVLYANTASDDVFKNWGLKVGDKLKNEYLDKLNEIIEDNIPKVLEFPVGDRIHSVTFNPLEDYVNIYGLDITERKQAEEALRESEEKYRMLYERESDAIFIFDPETFNIIDANEATSKMYEYDKDELVGMSCLKFSAEVDDSVSAAESARKNDVVHVPTNLHQKKDGSIFPVEVSGYTITLRGKNVMFAVSKDITERKQLEEEQAKASKLESIGLLAGGIAHDFNNILASILGNTSLAKLKIDSNSEEYEMLTETENATIRATKLTNQLLTFAKGGKPVKETIALANLIKETSRFSLRGSNVQYRTSIAANLWTTDVDKGQISQVIGNLVINAQQSMPNGGTINIKAKNVKIISKDNLPLEEGNYIRISFEDKGHGIPATQLANIFDPYFSTKQRGSGLGLATSYSIIQHHNGHIAVESIIGEGTTFTIYLPASSKKIKKIHNAGDESTLMTGKILVMDDDKSITKVVGMMISHLGNEVVIAGDGAEAIKMYKKALNSDKPFDVVIMDLTIPGGMGGKETIKKLLDINPEAKAIVSSGYSNDPVISNYKAHGFSGYIPKPYKLEGLKKVLNEVMSEK